MGQVENLRAGWQPALSDAPNCSISSAVLVAAMLLSAAGGFACLARLRALFSTASQQAIFGCGSAAPWSGLSRRLCPLSSGHLRKISERIPTRRRGLLDHPRRRTPILDIGRSCRGTIGRVKPKQVVAIDISPSELKEAPADFLKIVMDATDLKFLDGSFGTVTAFYSLMYMKPDNCRRQGHNEPRGHGKGAGSTEISARSILYVSKGTRQR